MFLERKTECGEKGVGLFVRLGGGHESDLHTVDPRVLVDVNLGEDDLLLETEGVIALAVHLLCDTVEFTDAREGDADESLEELVHLDVTKGNFHTDRHALTQTEVGNVLLGRSEDSLLADDLGELISCLFDELLVLGGVADSLVDRDLHESGNLHDSSVGELLHELVYDLLFIDLLEGRYIILRKCLDFYGFCCFLCHDYLISSPDFLA